MKNKSGNGRNFQWVYIFIPAIILIASIYLSDKIHVINRVDFVVSVLSLLVTIAVGWQIYSAVDINNRAKEIENYSQKLEIEIDKLNEDVSCNQIYSKACLEYMQAFTLLFQLNNDKNCRIDTNTHACCDAFIKSLDGFLKSRKATYTEIQTAAQNAITAANYFENKMKKDIIFVTVKRTIFENASNMELWEKLIDELQKAASPKKSGPGA